MQCEGLARQGPGFAWQIHFQQKRDVASRMQVHYLNGKRFPVPLKGRAWIDATNYEVVRLQTDIREPLKEAGLYAQHTDIEYGPVRFQKNSLASMVGSKAANGGQVKTGQRMWPGTQDVLPCRSH